MIYAADRGTFDGDVIPGGHGGRSSGTGAVAVGTGAVAVGDDRVGGESERGGRSLRLIGSTFHRGVAPNWSGSQ
jgi:hypothetical protein